MCLKIYFQQGKKQAKKLGGTDQMSESEKPNECVFCGKPRIKGRKIQWQSAIRIETDYGIKDQIATVCPDCRKKQSIQSLYEKVTALLIEEAKEIVAMEEGVEEEPEEAEKRPYRSPLW